MDRLEEEFGEEINFIRLNIDWDDTLDQRLYYGLTDRSQYVLVKPDGTIWQKWFGPLTESGMMLAMTEFLSELR